MAGKTRPSLRAKTLQNVATSNLSITDKECIYQVFKRFEELTKADFVEVVRRKDCKHWRTEHGGFCEASNALSEVNNANNDFCSYGEREDK